MKQVKILSLITAFSFFTLILASCAPGGTQPSRGWSGTVLANGILYVGSMDGKVIAVNSSTRNLEWSHTIATHSSGGMSCGQTSIPVAIYSTPTVAGDLIYIGAYNGKVLALSALARSQDLPFPQTRNGEWCYPKTNEVIGGIVGSPAVGEDAIYITSSDGRVYSLDKEFGDLNWPPVVLGEKLWTSPVIDNDTLYVSTFDGHIYTLSTEDGRILPWTFKGETGFVSSPVLYKDTLFVGSFDRNLYAVKIGADEPLWKFPGDNWFWAAPMVSEGVVYAGCLDGKIYAIDADSGKEVWKEPFDAESPIVASPLLVDGSLVVAAESGNVYVINPKTGIGERIKNPADGNKPTISALVRAPLCAYEGTVYIHAQDDCLYSVDINQRKASEPLPLSTKQES